MEWTTAYLKACGLSDPEYIGMTKPDRRNMLGYRKTDKDHPTVNPIKLEDRPYYGMILPWLESVVSAAEGRETLLPGEWRHPNRYPQGYLSGPHLHLTPRRPGR